MATALLGLALATGCGSAGSEGVSGDGSGSASCVGLIEVGGITYVPAGERERSTVPPTGELLHGRVLTCDDGGGRDAGHPVIAHTVPGVAVADAVAAQGYRLYVADRLWETPRARLPEALRRYLD